MHPHSSHSFAWFQYFWLSLVAGVGDDDHLRQVTQSCLCPSLIQAHVAYTSFHQNFGHLRCYFFEFDLFRLLFISISFSEIKTSESKILVLPHFARPV